MVTDALASDEDGSYPNLYSPTSEGRPDMCYVEAKYDIHIRKGPGRSYPTVGYLHQHQSLESYCWPTAGEYYEDCGGSYWWIEVYYHGYWYYVAYACVEFYHDDNAPDEHHNAIVAARDGGREAAVPPTPKPSPQLQG